MGIETKIYKQIVKSVPILAVDCIVINGHNKYLLLKRRNEPLRGQWWVPGGRVLRKEKVKHAVVRKCLEELGSLVHIIEFVGYYEDFFPKGRMGSIHTVSLVFLVKLIGNKVKLDQQHSAYKWSKKLPERFKVKKIYV